MGHDKLPSRSARCWRPVACRCAPLARTHPAARDSAAPAMIGHFQVCERRAFDAHAEHAIIHVLPCGSYGRMERYPQGFPLDHLRAHANTCRWRPRVLRRKGTATRPFACLAKYTATRPPKSSTAVRLPWVSHVDCAHLATIGSPEYPSLWRCRVTGRRPAQRAASQSNTAGMEATWRFIEDTQPTRRCMTEHRGTR